MLSTCNNCPELAPISKTSPITYNRNATNLLADTNIVSGFLHADKCNYLWILSDDDMLMEGSISKIMEILNHDMDVLFFTIICFINYIAN
jgi:hypothetical protein